MAESIDRQSVAFLANWISVHVQAGFEPLDVLEEGLEEVAGDEGIEDIEPWRERLQAEYRAYTAAEVAFPSNGPNVRITRAFIALQNAGIIALENAGYTQSDGWSDIDEVRHAEMPDAIGAAFYHMQDVERALTGDGLMIRFGGFNNNDAEIGQQVLETLRSQGLEASWSGDVNEVINIAPFTWMRRRETM